MFAQTTAQLLRLARPLSTSAGSRTALIKELRARTAAPMKKCVDALNKTGGDLEEAIAELRKAGLATAQKKASRGAHEGAVAVASEPHGLAVVELNSETDFVARNSTFQSLVASIARTAVLGASDSKGGELDLAALSSAELVGEAAPVSEAIGVAVGQLGENLVLRRACVLVTPPAGGVVCSYVHNTYAPGIGRTAAAVALRSDASDPDALRALGERIAMHITAASPMYLSREEVPEEAKQKEATILREQAKGSGKSEDVVNKMVAGRLNKFYQEMCLLDQTYLIEDKVSRLRLSLLPIGTLSAKPLSHTRTAHLAIVPLRIAINPLLAICA